MSLRVKRLLLFVFLPLALYLSLYTWNWKTRWLDRASTFVGLDISGWLLSPGRWIQDNGRELWLRYVYLVDVRQENEELTTRVQDLELRLQNLEEEARSAERMAWLLCFTPPEAWTRKACRVVGQTLGPNAVLQTMLVDVGSLGGVRENDPVTSPSGLVGRVCKPGLSYSSVLLLSDASSRIPVLTREGRVPGILQGQGPGAYLRLKYIPRNDSLQPGEVLITSGLGRIFPKGIPVARIIEVTPADVSLFQTVYAEPLLAPRYYEELLVLQRQGSVSLNATILGFPQVEDGKNASQGKNATSQRVGI